ncbi:MAG: hypothetical protein HY320_02955 [Armatimonadetes bacterium]|nr:hypothetical protein [Armatimonadota bacterium]
MMGLRRIVAGVLAAIVLAAGLALPTQALARCTGRRTTAAVLGGVAAYSLIKGHTTTGVLTGAGAAYAYHRYRQCRHRRHRRVRYHRIVHRRPPGFSRGRKVGWRGRSVPPGWTRGRKVGWHGRSVPPGHRR